ncbi:MAG: recombinase family protein [Rhizobiaceae bacterium]
MGSNPTPSANAATCGRSVAIGEADRLAPTLGPVIEAIRSSGVASYRGIANALNNRGIRTTHGGRWQVSNVRNVVGRRANAAEPNDALQCF